MSSYLCLWAEESNRIVEKLYIKLFFKQVGNTGVYIPTIIGSYFSIKNPIYVNNIHREFVTKEDALNHLKLSFDEFIDKFPHTKGFAKLSDRTEVIGNRMDKDWCLKFVEK